MNPYISINIIEGNYITITLIAETGSFSVITNFERFEQIVEFLNKKLESERNMRKVREMFNKNKIN